MFWERSCDGVWSWSLSLSSRRTTDVEDVESLVDRKLVHVVRWLVIMSSVKPRKVHDWQHRYQLMSESISGGVDRYKSEWRARPCLCTSSMKSGDWSLKSGSKPLL